MHTQPAARKLCVRHQRMADEGTNLKLQQVSILNASRLSPLPFSILSAVSGARRYNDRNRTRLVMLPPRHFPQALLCLAFFSSSHLLVLQLSPSLTLILLFPDVRSFLCWPPPANLTRHLMLSPSPSARPSPPSGLISLHPRILAAPSFSMGSSPCAVSPSCLSSPSSSLT